MIGMDYRKSIPYNVDNAKSNHDADASAADALGQGKSTLYYQFMYNNAYTSLCFF